jgi:hypothetical protein
MKSLIQSIGIAIGIVMLAGVPRASAQIASDQVEFTTTFAFTVGNATVPAGSYTIREAGDEPGVLMLTGTHASVLFLTQATEARETPTKTEVVFTRYGNGYVLKDIWMEGSNTGAETVSSEAERRVSKAADARGEHRIAARKKTGTASGQ